jgi:hypothetical protein
MRPDYRYPPAVLIDGDELAELKALLKRLVVALEKLAEGKKP